MKKLTLLFTMLLAVTLVNAQDLKFGAKAGMNLSTLTGDIDNAKMIAGFHVGGLVNIGLNDKFSIQPELLFSRQGVKYEETGNLGAATGTLEIKNHVNYINIPVIAQFEVIKGLKIEAGPQFGFFIGGKSKTEFSGKLGGLTYNEEGEEDIDSDTFETIDLGIGIGASYQTAIGLFIGGRYNLGLTNISKLDDTTTKNGVIQISVGYLL